jgi:hypothetical protein
MMDLLLMLVVLGVLALALGVDIAAASGWIRRMIERVKS